MNPGVCFIGKFEVIYREAEIYGTAYSSFKLNLV